MTALLLATFVSLQAAQARPAATAVFQPRLAARSQPAVRPLTFIAPIDARRDAAAIGVRTDDDREIICGMVVVRKSPDADAKILLPSRETAPRSGESRRKPARPGRRLKVSSRRASPLLLFAPARLRQPVAADRVGRQSHRVRTPPETHQQRGADTEDRDRYPPQCPHDYTPERSKNGSSARLAKCVLLSNDDDGLAGFASVTFAGGATETTAARPPSLGPLLRAAAADLLDRRDAKGLRRRARGDRRAGARGADAAAGRRGAARGAASGVAGERVGLNGAPHFDARVQVLLRIALLADQHERRVRRRGARASRGRSSGRAAPQRWMFR